MAGSYGTTGFDVFNGPDSEVTHYYLDSGELMGGELHYEQSGNQTVVMADIDGDGAADIEIQVNLVVALSAGDFVLCRSFSAWCRPSALPCTRA